MEENDISQTQMKEKESELEASQVYMLISVLEDFVSKC